MSLAPAGAAKNIKNAVAHEICFYESIQMVKLPIS